MKILKYIIFISILSSLFFVIYRQSDKKGFRRWQISFKTAVLIAASVAGLIPVNSEAIEPPGNNNPDDGQVILAKADGNPVTPPTNRGPSQFPSPPAGGRPSWPVYVPKYRTAPKVVPGPGLGAGANPAGAGGGVEVLNLMISVLFQKTKNHKNQKFLSMIILQMLQRKSNQLNSVSWKKMSQMEKSKLFIK